MRCRDAPCLLAVLRRRPIRQVQLGILVVCLGGRADACCLGEGYEWVAGNACGRGTRCRLTRPYGAYGAPAPKGHGCLGQPAPCIRRHTHAPVSSRPHAQCWHTATGRLAPLRDPNPGCSLFVGCFLFFWGGPLLDRACHRPAAAAPAAAAGGQWRGQATVAASHLNQHLPCTHAAPISANTGWSPAVTCLLHTRPPNLSRPSSTITLIPLAARSDAACTVSQHDITCPP